MGYYRNKDKQFLKMILDKRKIRMIEIGDTVKIFGYAKVLHKVNKAMAKFYELSFELLPRPSYSLYRPFLVLYLKGMVSEKKSQRMRPILSQMINYVTKMVSES